MRFRIDVRRKEGLSDPEGLTTQRALLDLGYESVAGVHFGRTIYVDITDDDPDAAATEVEEMCRRLLANPVMEDYSVQLVG